jgi:hypothetical protein
MNRKFKVKFYVPGVEGQGDIFSAEMELPSGPRIFNSLSEEKKRKECKFIIDYISKQILTEKKVYQILSSMETSDFDRVLSEQNVNNIIQRCVNGEFKEITTEQEDK